MVPVASFPGSGSTTWKCRILSDASVADEGRWTFEPVAAGRLMAFLVEFPIASDVAGGKG